MLPKNKNLIENAKELRRNMTREERRLWFEFLQKYPFKIYKQKIIGNYIVDFYCHKAKLVIELDGSQHYTDDGREYDAIRDEYLSSLGLKILRISNYDINKNFEGVCMLVHEKINEVNTNDKL